MLLPIHALPASRMRALADDLVVRVRAQATTAAGALRQWRLRARRRALERASHRELLKLDDATLRDLGLTRGELRGLAAEVAGRIEASHPRVSTAPWSRR